MQLRDIQYVLAAADEGKLSKAARKVHVSQPALSQLIQRLEDELGVKLFVRKSSQVTLTAAGQVFCEDGREIIRKSQELMAKMQEFQTLKKGELTIAIAPFYQKCYLVGVLEEYQKRYFDIRIKLVDAFSRDSEKLLLNGQVDLAFVILPYEHSGIQYEQIFEEHIYLAVPKQFPVNALLPNPEERFCRIDELKVLDDQPFIMYEKGRRMFKTSMDLCGAAGFAPRVAFESNSCESLNAMVARGMGVGFVPTSIDWIGTHSDRVSYYPIQDEEGIRTLTIGYLEKNITAAARKFIQVVLDSKRLQSK